MNKRQLTARWKNYTKEEKKIFWSKFCKSDQEVESIFNKEPNFEYCTRYSHRKKDYEDLELKVKSGAFDDLDEVIDKLK